MPQTRNRGLVDMNSPELSALSPAALDARRQTLVARLRRHLPADALLIEPDELRPFECDGLSAYREPPLAVAMPERADQVQAVLSACREMGLPVVARGAGTGLSGGALPLAAGLLLNMCRMNRLLELDVPNRLARVQPGVRNLQISELAAPHGLYYAPDPSSQIACSIGGNVAENAGGVHCLKYGLTVHNVSGIEIVTMDGQRLSLGGRALDSPGYDLLALLHGSEGLLAVITEIVVRLLPIPRCARVMVAAFDSVAAAGNAVARVVASGVLPAGLEMMDHGCIDAVNAFLDVDYPCCEALVLCELDGIEQEVTAQIAVVSRIMEEAGATSIRSSRNEAERLKLWSGRKAAFPAVGRISPDYYCMDGTIPRRHLSRVLDQIRTLSQRHGLPVVNVFHAGDGNMHPLILYDANREGELETAERLGGAILEACVAVGGTITGEHGVGVEKIDQMCVQFSTAELQQFHALKTAFDPDGLLNPGKAVPTLARCAEFGAMHVHGGQLPFPGLERF
jgi:glycolate oxidase